MMFTGWRATALVLLALVVVALLLTALFWIGVLIAALAVVAWFNIFLLPSIAFRTRIPQLLLALALLPIAAAAGLGLAGTGGLVAGCAIWVLGVALPRAALWRLRKRFAERNDRRALRVIDTTFSSRI
jgi:hypothetical protein